ncbi:MAG: hypothetical protein HY242_02165 [Afipia sp.]|nr:hypothetical protein [Afipia sp.]
MPAFMFEKISPPVLRTAQVQAVAIKEPRGVIVQMLDRLTANRLAREAKAKRRSRGEFSFTEADIKPIRTRGL